MAELDLTWLGLGAAAAALFAAVQLHRLKSARARIRMLLGVGAVSGGAALVLSSLGAMG